MNYIMSRKRVFSHKDGRCELLYGRFELPSLENGENKDAKYFSEYYEKIARCSEEWADKYALDDIKKEYDALTSHERKFRFRRYEYYVFFRAEEPDERKLSITISFKLMRNKNVLEQKDKTDIWDMGCLLMTRRGGKGRRMRRGKGSGMRRGAF